MNTIISILVPILLLAVAGQAWWIRKWMKDMEMEQSLLNSSDKELKAEFDREKKEIFDRVDIKFAEVLTRFTTMGEKLEGAISVMAENVNNMKTVVEVFKEQVTIKNIEFDRRIEENADWVEDHENELKQHSTRITKLESYCRFKHSKDKEPLD